MPARATRPNPYPYDPRAEARAEQEVYLLLGQGDPALGRDLCAFWVSWFLPEPPEGIANGWGRWLPKDGWMRFSGSRPPWTAILAHFRGQLALGGVYVKASRVLVLDADNQTGKRIVACGTPLKGQPIWRDASLEHRRRLLHAHQPHGYTVLSGPSGGYHRLTLLAEPVPHHLLVELGARRFRDLGAEVEPGSLEVLPSSTTHSLGTVIRAPFGPGSFLLDDQGKPVHTGPGEGIRILRDLVHRHGPTPAVKAFPGQVLGTQESLPTELPRPARHITTPATSSQPKPLGHDPYWVPLLHRVSGLAAPEDRIRGDALHAILRDIEAVGIPRAGLRRACTWPMAYHCRLRGLTLERAEASVLAWLDRHGARSRDYVRNPEGARQETRDIVAHVYRNGVPLPRKSRELPPIAAATDSFIDAVLRRLLDNDGELVAVAWAVLKYVRDHGWPTASPMVWRCRVPFAAVEVASRERTLTLRNVRLRRAFNTLLRLGLLWRTRHRIPKRSHDDPRGPQLAQPREYEFRWGWLLRDGALVGLQPPRAQSFPPKTAQQQPEGLSAPCSVERDPVRESPVEAVRGPKGRARPLWARVVVTASTGPAASMGPHQAREGRVVGGGPGEGSTKPRQLRLVWSAPGRAWGARLRRAQARSDDSPDDPG